MYLLASVTFLGALLFSERKFNMMKHYVCGFMFTKDLDKVYLIRKNRPLWQAGRLNGIGGSIESFDKTPYEAMVREFLEEAGVVTQPYSWIHFCSYYGENKSYCVKMFYNIDQTGLLDIKTQTDEEIILVPVSFVLNQHNSIIYNLKWLIPLAIDKSLNHKENGEITIYE